MQKPNPMSFRLPADKKAALEKAASEDGRSVSNMLELIVTDWLKAKGYIK